jgi:catechol 2,3-dioxygenase
MGALPDGLRLGPVRLTVTAIDPSVAFYQDVLGLRLHRREEAEVAMGDGERELVVLVENQGARPAGRHAGLYHYCLLFGSRDELARAAVRIAVTGTAIQGASDHGTHEAIYLADPHGNGIELAADRPRTAWPDVRSPAGYAGGPAALDIQGVLAEVAGEQPRRHVARGMAVGHMHLHVGDVGQALAFYRDALGFDLMVNLGTAAFVSSGGYHHHLGFNIWRGVGVPALPAGSVGLREWTIVLPEAGDVEAARGRLARAGAQIEERPDGFLGRDPWGIPVAVTA